MPLLEVTQIKKLTATVLLEESTAKQVDQYAAFIKAPADEVVNSASRNPEGLHGLILVAPAPPTPLRFPDEARETQIHAYDNRENVLQTIKLLSSRMPAPTVVEQIVEDSTSGSREATLAYPNASILEDISSEVSKINVPTLVLAGELDQLDSIEQHKREVVARIPNAQFAIVKGSGHLIPIDEPIHLAKEIASFVTLLAG